MDFRAFLQDELLRRIKRNPKYSLRAYARALSTDYSTLSKILRAQRPLGARNIARLGAELGLSPAQIAAFIGRDAPAPAPATRAYRSLTAADEDIAGGWHYDAIMELMRVKGFQSHPRWLAKALGLPVADVKTAVARLVAAGLLRIPKKGLWQDDSGGRTTSLGEPKLIAAGRARQRQVLSMAARALDEVPLADRDQTSITVAVDKSKLAEARRRIQTFRRDLSAFLGGSPNLDEVYHLSVSLYPITQASTTRTTHDRQARPRPRTVKL